MREAERTFTVGCLVIVSVLLTGCHRNQWDAIQLGRSNCLDVDATFKTCVAAEDRYAYAIDRNERSGETELIMVNIDDDGIVSAKYSWHWDPRPTFSLTKRDVWKMTMQTLMAPPTLQEYSLAPGPREEALLEYFGRTLYDTSKYFEHVSEVFGATNSMKKIFTLAASEYSTRPDKQSLLSKDGFIFDGGIYGKDCTMVLVPLDEHAGLYEVTLKGHSSRKLFSGWR